MSNKLENSRVLILGASGFIGGFLVKEILKEPVKEVILYDNFTRGKKIDLILEKIKKNTLKKETLAGCVIKKVNQTIIITKEH